MYETFFGLKRRPFLAVPDTESYFPTPLMEESRLVIERTVRRGEGISLVFGQAGVGKSLLLRILRKSLEDDFDTASLAGGRLNNVKAFLQNLLHELHLPYAGADEAELRLTLDDYVKNQTSQGLLLLIDESQFLDRIPLDEIRLLLNSDNGSASLFRVVLAGTNEFEEKLTLPQFDSFNQRVTTRTYLDILSRTETFQYITWQTNLSKYNEKNTAQQKKNHHYSNSTANVQLVGESSGALDVLRIDFPHCKNSEPIFTDIAKEEIFRLTDGLPRQINQLCDTALQLAAQQAVSSIDEILILAAWGKLQQINVDDMLSKRANNNIVKVKTENYDAIIERKKNKLRLKEVSEHIEYGSLDDDTKILDPHEELKSTPAYKVYKPPYPEDDSGEFKKFDIDTNNDIDANVKIDTDTDTDIEIGADVNVVATENEIVVQNAGSFDEDNVVVESDSVVVGADDFIDAEFDDDSVEHLISFELSTSTIDSFGQAKSDRDILDFLPVLHVKLNQLGYPFQRQLFVSKNLHVVQKKGERRFSIRFLPPRNSLMDLESCVEELRAVQAAYYSYPKPVLCWGNNNSSASKLAEKRVCVKLNFTVWRKRIVHSWIGNLSVGRISITTRFLDTDYSASCTNKNTNQNIDVNTNKNIDVNENDTSNIDAEFSSISNNKFDTDTKTEIGIDIDSEGLKMNRETLEKYGAAVLSGHPQFVRKEPVYVYQTGEKSAFVHETNSSEVDKVKEINEVIEVNNIDKVNEVDKVNDINEVNNIEEVNEVVGMNDIVDDVSVIIPIVASSELSSSEVYVSANGVDLSSVSDVEIDAVLGGDVVDKACCVGGEIVLNWVNETFDSEQGFGVAYREFAANSGNNDVEQVLSSVAETLAGGGGSGQTSFEERFDETIRVMRSTITLDEIYRSVRKYQNEPQVSRDVLLNIERQVADAVKRITLAVDKIEFVAEQAEDAGRRVSDAADLTNLAGQKIEQTAANVEAEVMTAIPNYKDMFKQLADFQKTITHEIQYLKYQNENQDNENQDNNINSNENNFSFNKPHPHELKTYRNSIKRLSRPISSDNIKLPTAEIRGSEIKTIDIKSLFKDGDI
jgi:type II secretory pathway predicted ATPase ExeA